MAAILAQRAGMPKEEACTTRSGERAARGVALGIISSPGAAHVRPQKQQAFCYVSRTEKATLLPRVLARNATSPYRAQPPSATTAVATTVTVARNGKSPRRATIVPPSRTHSNANVTLSSPLRSDNPARRASARLDSLDRLPLGDRAAILRQARARARVYA